MVIEFPRPAMMAMRRHHMAKTKQARKRAAPEPTVPVGKQLVQALAAEPNAKAGKHAEAPRPQVGDRVTVSGSAIVYTVTRASDDNKDVDLQRAGTNIARFRVPVTELTFVDKVPEASPAVSRPARPAFDVEDIRERVVNVQHTNLEQLDSDIAILKKYFKGTGIPVAAIKELEGLRKVQADSWNRVVEAISTLLEMSN